YLIARKDPRAFLGIESTGIQSQFFSQLTVELNQPRLRHLRRLPGNVEALKFARIGIVEGESRGGRVVRDVRHRVTSLVRGNSESSAIILLDIDRNIYTCREECARIFSLSSDGRRGALHLSVSSVRLGRRGDNRSQTEMVQSAGPRSGLHLWHSAAMTHSNSSISRRRQENARNEL